MANGLPIVKSLLDSVGKVGRKVLTVDLSRLFANLLQLLETVTS